MKTKIKQTGLAHFYLPFTRVAKDERIVEGYCFTSSKVKGDKWNLKRGALEAATASYLEMPCIRSMHSNIAAGVGQEVIWDEKGCLLRAKIVDDNEWNKVKEGVYRGFSLGGKPLIARGNDIESFDWIETSLVDRPCDPGALFTMARGEGADTEYEVEVEPGEEAEAEATEPVVEVVPAEVVAEEPTPEPVAEVVASETPEPETTERVATVAEKASEFAARVAALDTPLETERSETVEISIEVEVPTFAEQMTALTSEARYNEIDNACRALCRTLLSLSPEAQRQSVVDFTGYVNGWIDRYADTSNTDAMRAELTTTLQRFEAVDTDLLTRAQAAEAQATEAVTRAEKAESELSEVGATLEAAIGNLERIEGEVKRLREMPVARPAVVRNLQAAERSFSANTQAPDGRAVTRAALEASKAKIEAELDANPSQIDRNALVGRLIAVEAQLAYA